MKTSTFKIAIVDDEADARGLIRLLLKDYFPEMEVVCDTGDFSLACREITKLQPELLFLDVEMPGGSGFELLEGLPEQPPAVIFTTAHDKYAIRAIKAAAADYVLKPLSSSEFRASVEKVKACLLKTQRAEDLAFHKRAYAHISKIAVPTLNGLDFLEIEDILYLEADSNYTNIYLPARKEVVCRTLAQFETELAPFGFLRTHHKYLIHLKKVKHYSKGKGGGCITLENNALIPVSARKKSEFFRYFVY